MSNRRKRRSRVVLDGRAPSRSHSKAPAKRKKSSQGELAFRSWGGARKGAGRKRKSDRPQVPHLARPQHTERFPVLVTSRLVPGLPSLRRTEEARRVVAAIAGSLRAAEGSLDRETLRGNAGRQHRTAGTQRDHAGTQRDHAGTQRGSAGTQRASDSSRPSFQVVHYSIQSNHLHFIVEAHDRRALSSGLRGLLIRIAFALNKLWNRRGSVLAGRFHERELLNPRQVRNALVYVLNNGRKHGVRHAGPDPLSSGARFDGWLTDEDGRIEEQRPLAPRKAPAPRGRVAAGPAFRATRFGGSVANGGRAGAPRSIQRAARSELPRASTWLLAQGWKRHGLIDLWESPRES